MRDASERRVIGTPSGTKTSAVELCSFMVWRRLP
jgi:hypothetical protein